MDDMKNPTYWGKDDILLRALERLGAHFVGDRNWDGVEMHRVIFGDLPMHAGDDMFICTGKKRNGTREMGDFLVKLADAIYEIASGSH